MPRIPPFVFGSPLTVEEFAQVRARIVPDWQRRCKKVPPGEFLQAVHNAMPHRLAFEVDRLRGLAFEAGEAGFIFAVVPN